MFVGETVAVETGDDMVANVCGCGWEMLWRGQGQRGKCKLSGCRGMMAWSKRHWSFEVKTALDPDPVYSWTLVSLGFGQRLRSRARLFEWWEADHGVH
jgi:hypothetical protein